MANYNFDKDYAGAGQPTEKLLGDMFISRGYTVQFNHDYRFDIKATKDGRSYTVEVKYDIMSSKTGNVGVEFSCRGKSSGISVTQADIHAYRIGDNMYFIWTDNLKKLIADKRYFKVVNGGDAGSDTLMYLFKMNVFAERCKRINI